MFRLLLGPLALALACLSEHAHAGYAYAHGGELYRHRRSHRGGTRLRRRDGQPSSLSLYQLSSSTRNTCPSAVGSDTFAEAIIQADQQAGYLQCRYTNSKVCQYSANGSIDAVSSASDCPSTSSATQGDACFTAVQRTAPNGDALLTDGSEIRLISTEASLVATYGTIGSQTQCVYDPLTGDFLADGKGGVAGALCPTRTYLGDNCVSSTAATCQPISSLSLEHPIALTDSSLAIQPIANGLRRPRAIIVDSANNLLVLDAGRGIIALTESESCGGYEQRNIVADTSFNHGIALEGSTLYVTNADALYSFDYSPVTFTASNRKTLVTGMAGPSHSTRSIVLTATTVILNRGSEGNLDQNTERDNTAQIRSFSLATINQGALDWAQGTLVAKGTRNDVGMALAPGSPSKLYLIENSADNLRTAGGVDVHNTNPAEELNLVDLSATARDYGYPFCFTVFDGSVFSPQKTTGSQFSIDSAVTDAQCETRSVAPRLSLPAHFAPLDIRFLTATDTSFDASWVNSAFVASHGSWNSNPPVGYALLRIPFSSSTWEPVAPASSNNGYETIFAPPNLSACPGGCFRPVGVAIERGRPGANGLFVSSDSTGEIIRVYKP